MKMINCEECTNYAQHIFERGEITQDEINKLALDRHILKGCDTDFNDYDKLRKVVVFHLYSGKSLERACNKFGFPVPKEYLEGYKQGLRTVLKMMSTLESER